ncbi:MAG: M24 family metallopeptidase [Nitrospirota bacterium]
MSRYASRLQHVQRLLTRKKIDALYVGAIKNVRYLTGFTGSSGFVLISRDRGVFVTDFRYQEQAGNEVKGYEIEIERGKRIKVLQALLKKLGAKRLGFETSLSYEFYALLKTLPLVLSPQSNLIENLRKVKDAEEVAAIREAVRRAEEAFLAVKPRIKAGVRERDIALRLEEQLKKTGCRSIPFDIIVASGNNASMPHARATEKKIAKGDFVIIDWGGEADGYFSDMTRTLLMSGEALSEKRAVYEVVNSAREKAVQSVKKGVTTRAVDAAARDTIKKAGYGDFFGHGTGHGIGLDVHEAPRVSWLRSERIADGTVFTIEPGIYIPHLGGVRIEDMVLMEKGKGVVLTTLGRELEIIRS